MNAPQKPQKRKYTISKRNPGWFKKTHGKCKHHLYKLWSSMISRCSNKNAHLYSRYGGRGIKVCKRWQKFENFHADMGRRPKGTTLDRIDNGGDYSPSNCRWSDQRTQQNNRSNNVRITYDGRTMTSAQWAREKGLNRNTLWFRLKSKWSIAEALNFKPDFRSRYGR